MSISFQLGFYSFATLFIVFALAAIVASVYDTIWHNKRDFDQRANSLKWVIVLGLLSAACGFISIFVFVFGLFAGYFGA